MGPMGPMGPMSGGWGSNTAAWLVLGVAVLAVLAIGIVVLAGRGVEDRVQSRRPTPPEELLRERYARGELGRQQYLDALVDVLKDRYVRGELTLDEYEARLGLLLGSPL